LQTIYAPDYANSRVGWVAKARCSFKKVKTADWYKFKLD